MLDAFIPEGALPRDTERELVAMFTDLLPRTGPGPSASTPGKAKRMVDRANPKAKKPAKR
jgi:hypothetical protein